MAWPLLYLIRMRTQLLCPMCLIEPVSCLWSFLATRSFPVLTGDFVHSLRFAHRELFRATSNYTLRRFESVHAISTEWTSVSSRTTQYGSSSHWLCARSCTESIRTATEVRDPSQFLQFHFETALRIFEQYRHATFLACRLQKEVIATSALCEDQCNISL